MKRRTTVIILLIIVVVFTVALYYLWQKNQQNPITYTSELPSEQTIVVKTVATGSIVPKEEVLIKPNISYNFFASSPFTGSSKMSGYFPGIFHAWKKKVQSM